MSEVIVTPSKPQHCTVLQYPSRKEKGCKNKSSVKPKSTSNQSSKPCTVLQYPSRKVKGCQKKIETERKREKLGIENRVVRLSCEVKEVLFIVRERERGKCV